MAELIMDFSIVGSNRLLPKTRTLGVLPRSRFSLIAKLKLVAISLCIGYIDLILLITH
jgi:hypothetical protein